MAIWTQPMHTHNLTQTQDLGSYAQSIQSRISLASKPRTPGQRGTLAWIAGAVLNTQHFVLFCVIFFFQMIRGGNKDLQ